MFVDSNFYHDNNAKRFGLACGAAILAHGLILAWFSYAPIPKLLESNLASPPTNITISFSNSTKETPQIKKTMPSVAPNVVKKVVPKVATIIPMESPAEKLNRIEPAAMQQQAQQPLEQATPVQRTNPIKPTPITIPIISDSHIKGRRIQPKYPERALRMKQEGIVWLRVLISETGARQEIKLHKPSQYALLNQAAIKAVKKWTFGPNIVNGRATKSWVEIPIEFKIQ